jgi:hypothetical protein
MTWCLKILHFSMESCPILSLVFATAASWQSKPQRVATDSPVYHGFPISRTTGKLSWIMLNLVRKVQCFCWLSYSNTSYSCTIMHHHAQLMHPSCYPPLLWNAIKRLNKMSLDGSTAATSKTAGQMRTPSRPMNVPKNLDSDHYTTSKKRRSRKSNPGPATWGLTSSRICMSRQTRAQATASAWLTATLRHLKQVCFSGPSLNRCHFRQPMPGNCQGLECHLVTLSGSFTSNGWKTHRGTGFLDVSVSANTIKDL